MLLASRIALGSRLLPLQKEHIRKIGGAIEEQFVGDAASIPYGVGKQTASPTVSVFETGARADESTCPMDPIRTIKLRWVQSGLTDVTYQLTRLQFAKVAPPPWEPAINAYQCPKAIRICVDLAGVDRASLHIHIQPHRLVLHGTRDVPEPRDEDACDLRTLAMEIDYGPFMRSVPFPSGMEVDVDQAKAEQDNGLLWIYLPLKGS